MARSLLRVIVATLALCAGAASLFAAQDALRFRSTADNVPLFVTVTGKSGRLVTDLTQDAFEVRDQGKPRPIVLFDNSPQPVRLIVLIDVSGSMTGNLSLLRAACQELIAHLGARDLARIGTFGRDVEISPAFTRDPRALMAALPVDINPNAPTPLWRAIDQAIGAFDTSEGRRVVLVLSDGKDTGPGVFTRKIVDAVSVSDRAEREDVMIYGVALSSRPPVNSIAPRPQDLGAMLAANMPDPGLARLAEDTGGGYAEIRPRQDLSAEFGRIVDELHQQYLLGFVPADRDGKTHKVEVKVRGGLELRARQTYRAPTN
jgi:Ca-activated chloride channel family protein